MFILRIQIHCNSAPRFCYKPCLIPSIVILPLFCYRERTRKRTGMARVLRRLRRRGRRDRSAHRRQLQSRRQGTGHFINTIFLPTTNLLYLLFITCMILCIDLTSFYANISKCNLHAGVPIFDIKL